MLWLHVGPELFAFGRSRRSYVGLQLEGGWSSGTLIAQGVEFPCQADKQVTDVPDNAILRSMVVLKGSKTPRACWEHSHLVARSGKRTGPGILSTIGSGSGVQRLQLEQPDTWSLLS